LTLLLLSAAGLVLKSFAKMQSTRLGFEPQDMLTARIELPFTKYTELQPILNFTNSLLDEVRTLPGVQNAALSANPPMIGNWQINFQPKARRRPIPASNRQRITKSCMEIISPPSRRI
jgi:hypothetical protein